MESRKRNAVIALVNVRIAKFLDGLSADHSKHLVMFALEERSRYVSRINWSGDACFIENDAPAFIVREMALWFSADLQEAVADLERIHQFVDTVFVANPEDSEDEEEKDEETGHGAFSLITD